jgi:O-antigen/teichoic acid export membrane protein
MSKFLTNLKSFLFENKTLHQTIFKNIFWLAVAEVIDRGLGFLVVIWIARHFGPAAYGRWSFAINFVVPLIILVDFGFAILTAREIARDKSKTAQYIDNILVMKLILGVITFGIIAVAINLFGKEVETVKLVYFLGIYYIINTFALFFRSIFQANEKMQYETVCRIIQGVSELILVAIFMFSKASIITVSYAYTIGCLFGILFSLIFIWRFFSRFFHKIDFNFCKEILKESWPIALSGFLGTFYLSFGVIFLSLLKADKDVGWYGAGYSLIPAIMVLPNLFMAALYPRLSKMYTESKNDFINMLKKGLKYIFILDLILIPLIFIFSRQIIILLYGKSYINSIIVFRILLVMVFIDYIGCVLMSTLYAIKRQIVYTKIIFSALILNIILSGLLIPMYSYVGLGVAMLVSDCFLAISAFLYIKKTVFDGNTSH